MRAQKGSRSIAVLFL